MKNILIVLFFVGFYVYSGNLLFSIQLYYCYWFSAFSYFKRILHILLHINVTYFSANGIKCIACTQNAWYAECRDGDDGREVDCPSNLYSSCKKETRGKEDTKNTNTIIIFFYPLTATILLNIYFFILLYHQLSKRKGDGVYKVYKGCADENQEKCLDSGNLKRVSR